MNRDDSLGTLSGSDSDTIAGESLIKSKHLRTMAMGCVTAPCSVNQSQLRCSPPCTPSPSAFLAPPMSSTSQLNCLVHREGSRQCVAARRLRSVRFKVTKSLPQHKLIRGPQRLCDPRISPPIHMRPSPCSWHLAAPSQPSCLTGARLDGRVLSFSRIVSSFPNQWHSTRCILDGAPRCIPAPTRLCKMIGCLFPTPPTAAARPTGDAGALIDQADPAQVAVNESTAPRRCHLETCYFT